VEGAAGLDVPEDRRARRKGGPNEAHKSRRAIRREEKKIKRAQKQAKKDALEAEASARRSRLAELTETLGPQAAKQALRSETNEARQAKKKERVDARNAEKQARKARRKMIRDQTRPNRRGRESFSHAILMCATFFCQRQNLHHQMSPGPLGPSLFSSF
jgi:hypothetical protein